MEYINLLQEIIGQRENLQNVLTKYVVLLQLAGVVFCLLNCLFGYKLRKFWTAVMVFLIGGGGILAVGNYFMENKIGVVATAFVAGLMLAILSVQVYRIALFVVCAGLTYGVLTLLIPDPIAVIKAVYILMGILIGRMVLRFERPLVIIITAVCGGFGASKLLFTLLENGTSRTMLLAGLMVAVIGMVLQFITTGVEEEEVPTHNKKRKHKKRKPVEKSVFQLMRESMRGEDEDENELEEYYDEYDDEYDEEAYEYEEYVEPARRRQSSSIHTYDEILDMDDINKEMSQEIQQIYQEKKKRGRE